MQQAAALSREVLQDVEKKIDAHAKDQRLIEIYNKLDARSSAVFKGQKFKVSLRESSFFCRYM